MRGLVGQDFNIIIYGLLAQWYYDDRSHCVIILEVSVKINDFEQKKKGFDLIWYKTQFISIALIILYVI